MTYCGHEVLFMDLSTGTHICEVCGEELIVQVKKEDKRGKFEFESSLSLDSFCHDTEIRKWLDEIAKQHTGKKVKIIVKIKGEMCPRCDEEAISLVGRKDGKKIEGRYDKVCEECVVAIQDDEFDKKYID